MYFVMHINSDNTNILSHVGNFGYVGQVYSLRIILQYCIVYVKHKPQSLTVICCIASSTAIWWHSKAFRPALAFWGSASPLAQSLFLPHLYMSAQRNPSSRQGQPCFFLSLPLPQVFLQLQNCNIKQQFKLEYLMHLTKNLSEFHGCRF